MITGHKHWIVTVPSWDTWYVHALRYPLLHFTATPGTPRYEQIDASPYPYGPCPNRDGACLGHRECWTLSTLAILHRWTGLTLYRQTPEEGTPDDGGSE